MQGLDAPELSRVRVFLESVRRGQGTPADPRQKGEGGFFPGLTAQPWHDGDMVPTTRRVTTVLEHHAPVITAEYQAARAAGGLLIPHPASSLHPSLSGRDWGFFELWNGGSFRAEALERLPETCRGLATVADLFSPAGQVAFHCMESGARLRPHADGPNMTLTCHLGIDVPSGCALRVAGETRTWANGRCLWFDHSFEHDAWNEGVRSRTILLLDIVHPDLTEPEVEFWRAMWQRQRGGAT